MDSDLLKRLSEVTAAYGANPARWPKAERERLERAAEARPDALAEAQEIDRVLGLARAPRSAADGRSRLLQAIAHERQSAPSTVIPMPVRRRSPRLPGWQWAAAAMLAASLACGIYLGTLDSTNSFFSPDLAANDDPVDLAGLGDISDYLEGEG